MSIPAGTRFGLLTILRDRDLGPPAAQRVSARCDCGTETDVSIPSMLAGYTKSCGCLRTAPHAEPHHLTHGLSRSPTYNSWVSMLQRCTNPNHDAYERYGGRGITVCERWSEFTDFLADMGERPQGRTLDRIDNEGNYEPGNCRWATPQQQVANRRASA